ncbi:MAG: methyltransferase [Sphingobium sp.]|nr:class I SAM-dependent methyltransferase [Sphingobium sp.]MCP5397965.1 class I SAM-dependent methyltransferase [Sphingomonas sp.]
MRPALIASLIAFSAIVPAGYVLANHHEAADDAISTAVSADSRTPAYTERDVYRHPAETLAFFGVQPGQTVFEYAPGGGWYSEILGPLLSAKGTFYAAAPAGKYYDMIAKKVSDEPSKYGQVKLMSWPLAEGAVAPGSVDTVLTFRNVHNLVMNGSAPAAFSTFYEMLKPGGTLGVVDHRLPEDRDSAQEKASGYVKTSTVRKLAEDAGFVLEAQSEINANPKDSANWEKGVWTLPPVLRNGETDREKYLAIGESDRMTLRFRKPAS